MVDRDLFVSIFNTFTKCVRQRYTNSHLILGDIIKSMVLYIVSLAYMQFGDNYG